MPGRNRQQRNPASDTILRQGILKTLDRTPQPKPDRGENVPTGSLEPATLNWLDLKAIGERIGTGHPESQTAEIQTRVALMNRFSAL